MDTFFLPFCKCFSFGALNVSRNGFSPRWYTYKGHNLVFLHVRLTAVGRILPGTSNVGNVVHARDHDAEPALGGPGEGARGEIANCDRHRYIQRRRNSLHFPLILYYPSPGKRRLYNQLPIGGASCWPAIYGVSRHDICCPEFGRGGLDE